MSVSSARTRGSVPGFGPRKNRPIRAMAARPVNLADRPGTRIEDDEPLLSTSLLPPPPPRRWRETPPEDPRSRNVMPVGRGPIILG